MLLRPRVGMGVQWAGEVGAHRRRGLLLEYGPLEPIPEALPARFHSKTLPVPAARRVRRKRRTLRVWSRAWGAARAYLGALRASRTMRFLVQYLQQSTMHGMAHISTTSRRHPLERVLWVLVVVLAWYGTFYISLSTWRRYRDNPTVISLERDYMAWNTTFPSITVCPNAEGRVDQGRLSAVVEALGSEFRVQNLTSLRTFVLSLATTTLHSLKDIPDSHGIPGDRFLQIIEEVAPTWNYSVVTSLASDLTTVAYEPRLVATLSEMGLCYAFNSLVAPYISPRYWRLGEAGLRNLRGLLEVNIMDGSVFGQLSGLPSGYQLFVHSPGEVLDLQAQFLSSPEGQFKALEVTALAITTTEGVRWLSPEQRRCRFTDEPPRASALWWPGPVYSYNLCRRACRARVALRECRCVPHLYGPMYNSKGERAPTCDMKGLSCVTKNIEFVSTLKDPVTGEKAPCNCLANCNEVSYVVDTDTNNPWFLGTDLKWSLSKFPRMRLKRDLLFGVTDLLVHIGSTAGLFLGCSVLSIIELLYFLTLRLYWFSRSEEEKHSSIKGLDEITNPPKTLRPYKTAPLGHVRHHSTLLLK